MNASAAPVLQHECEPASRAQARNGWRAEREGNGFRNFPAHSLVQGLHESIGGKFWSGALVPGIKLKEIEPGVRRRSVGEQAETRNPAETFNTVSVRQHVIHLAHHRVGALERRGVGQL